MPMQQMNPAVRSVVDGLRPCHEPPATSAAVQAVYDTVTRDAFGLIDNHEVRAWLTGVVQQAAAGLPSGVEAASTPGAELIAAAVLQALST